MQGECQRNKETDVKKKITLTIAIVLVMFLMSAIPAVADEPEYAGGKNSKWVYGDVIYIGPSELYIGPDYGAGTTETWCSDGTWIDVIVNAFLWADGHYFSEWWEPYDERDWVYYKFWLDENHPVDMILADGSSYIATEFIFIKVWMLSQEHVLVAYK